MKKKDVHMEIKGPSEGKPTGLPGPLVERSLGYAALDALRLFESARSVLQARGLRSAEALSDFDPPLFAELRKRDLLGLLTHSLQIASFDHPEVEKQVAEVFKRQSIPATPAEISRLVSLIPSLYTVPDFQHVKDKAIEAGIQLNDEEAHKMCWVLRGFIQYMNQRP